MTNQLHEHYILLLSLGKPWKAPGVNLGMGQSRATIGVGYAGSKVKGPECGKRCKIRDYAPRREWRHLDGLLGDFRHRITNSVSEGINSKIQFIKASAWGFRSFGNYRIRILFSCGKLSLSPEITH